MNSCKVNSYKSKSVALSLAVGGLLLIGLLLLLDGAPFTAHAASAILYVAPGASGDCAQSTPCDLQYALGQATDGDTIYLAHGTYTGTGTAVITVSKNITLYGGWDGSPTGSIVRDPETYPTILDGEGQRRVVYIYTNVTVTLDGLVIAHGNGSHDLSYPGQGGGILSTNATPIIVNCLITGNVAYTGTAGYGGRGGGMRIVNPQGTAVITGNRIISNLASLQSTGVGGGIDLIHAPGALVANNAVLSNTAAISAERGYGGGIAVEGNSQGTILSSNHVEGNVALARGNNSLYLGGYGGGIDISSPSVTITDNVVVSNTAVVTGATGYGGGIRVTGNDVVVANNQIEYNVAQQETHDLHGNQGGGLYCFVSEGILIRANTIRYNTASRLNTGSGGGVSLNNCDRTTLLRNRIEGNGASVSGNGYGGGFHAYGSSGLLVEANWVISNTASEASPWGRGGGLFFSRNTLFTMTNNIVVENHASLEGGGVAFETSSTEPVTGRLVHNTFAANDRGEGDGRIAVHLNQAYVTLVLTNNLIYSHTYGVYAVPGSAATLYSTLFYAHSDGDTGGAGTVTNIAPITGADPLLDADYHLQDGSPAIDAGVNVPWVVADIDGDARSEGLVPDIGADEWVWTKVYLPLVVRNFP